MTTPNLGLPALLLAASLLLSQVACSPREQGVAVHPAAVTSSTSLPSAPPTAPSTPSMAAASASSAPSVPATMTAIDPMDPYRAVLESRLLQLVGLKSGICQTGWTGSLTIVVENNQVQNLEDHEQRSRVDLEGKALPPVPPHLVAFFSKPVLVGLCAAYMKYRD